MDLDTGLDADLDADLEADLGRGEPARLTPTGHPEVDAVLDTMMDLPERPVAEHVAVFENAHETLRRTLAGAGQPQEG